MKMKRILLAALSLGVILIAGCVVTSIAPFYTEKDLVFDAALVGIWVDEDRGDAAKESWKFEKESDKEYKLTLTDDGKPSEFEAHLFKFKGQLLLDLFAKKAEAGTVPAHG